MRKALIHIVGFSIRALRICMLGAWALLFATHSYGQQKFDLQAIVNETQKIVTEDDQITVVWWLPEEYWIASLSQDPNVSQAQIDQLTQTLRPYTTIAVVSGEIGAFGGTTFRSEQEVGAAVQVKDGEGRAYRPLGDDAIDPSAKNFVQIMKPILANMLGPLGNNMHFLLFPGLTEDDKRLFDPTRDGVLTVVVSGEALSYRLPLGSMLPPKFDPQTKERFPGNFNFNPFTGSELVVTP